MFKVGVSEPSDFCLEAGNGPFTAISDKVGHNDISLTFIHPLIYRGITIQNCVVKPRYEGESFADWDGNTAKLVNIVTNISSLTHLVGGIKICQPGPQQQKMNPRANQ